MKQATADRRDFTGIALEDKKPNERTLKVWVEELQPFMEGDITPMEVVSDGVTLVNYIICDYLDETNRSDPPDVHKGEQITVVQFSYSKKYYWQTKGRNDNLRRTEHHRISISNNPDVGGERNDDNTYFMEFDSREDQRCINIKTSKANKEPFMYTIQLNAKAGFIHICDDDNNEIYLESVSRRIRLRNNTGSIINIDDQDITINAVRDIIMKSGRQIVTDTKVFTNKVTNTYTLNAQAISFNGGNTVSTTAPCIGLNGAVVAPKTVVTGPHRAESYNNGNPKDGETPPEEKKTEEEKPNRHRNCRCAWHDEDFEE